MLRSLKKLRGFPVAAADGAIGTLDDVIVEDTTWGVRYVVVHTGGWLTGKLVLVAPQVIRPLGAADERLALTLTRDEVKASPDLATAPTIEQKEKSVEELAIGQHDLGLRPPVYGATSLLWAAESEPFLDPVTLPRATAPVPEGNLPDPEIEPGPHLRQLSAVRGSRAVARDGELGKVEDFLVDDEGWLTRYLVVDTGSWLDGRRVLVAPGWVTGASWRDREVTVDLARADIEASPPYDPEAWVSRSYETALYDHYRRNRYWSG